MLSSAKGDICLDETLSLYIEFSGLLSIRFQLPQHLFHCVVCLDKTVAWYVAIDVDIITDQRCIYICSCIHNYSYGNSFFLVKVIAFCLNCLAAGVTYLNRLVYGSSVKLNN